MKKMKIGSILMIGAALSLQMLPASAVVPATNTPVLGCSSGTLSNGMCVQQNAITVVPTTPQTNYSCPEGVLIGNTCQIAGGYINAGKTIPYEMVSVSWGSYAICSDHSYTFDQSDWPNWFCYKTTAPTTSAAIQHTTSVCLEGTLTNGSCSVSTPVASIQATSVPSYSCNGVLTLIDQNCYTASEVTNIVVLSPFESIKTWSKTYLLPSILGFVIFGVFVRLVIGAVRKRSSTIV